MRKNFLIFSFFVGIALVFSSCVLCANSVSGKITYDGVIPKFRPLNMSGDPECMHHHNKKVYPEVLVLGANKTMANVIVSVVNPPSSSSSVPSNPLVLDQDGCIYQPHVFCLRVGQKLKILNPDPVLHNVHAMPKINKEFNMAMPKFRKVAIKKFDKEEITPFPIKCDVHPWMTAWVSVFSHPFYSVTGKDGTFKIDNLPKGHYKIQAWHEKLGLRTLEVDIPSKSSAKLDFTFKR